MSGQKENKNILVVDDSLASRHIVADMLSALGYEFSTAENGKAALVELTKNQDFLVVIADVHMDQMDGIELLKHIRQELPSIDVIIMTGQGKVFFFRYY